MIRRPIQPATALALSLVSVALLLLAYTGLAHRQKQINPTDTTIPTWSQLASGVRQLSTPNRRTGERWVVEDLKASGARLGLGLGTGVVGGILLGMFMGCLRAGEAFFHPPLAFLAQVPPTAALAVFFVLAGTGQVMFVSMIAVGILPALAMTVFLAVKEFPEDLQFTAYTLGASHAEVGRSISRSINARCQVFSRIDSTFSRK